MHKKFFSHLETLAKHSPRAFHYREKNFPKGEMTVHEFLDKRHHESIKDFLEDFSEKHPHAAEELALHMLKMCHGVLNSRQRHEHHEHIEQLSADIQRIRIFIGTKAAEATEQWNVSGEMAEHARNKDIQDIHGAVEAIISDHRSNIAEESVDNFLSRFGRIGNDNDEGLRAMSG